MEREPRFPGITWYCDHCGASLSSQEGFDDHKYTWKCRKCGYKNSISWDNIRVGDSNTTRLLLLLLGFPSVTGLWTSIMLAISIFIFRADRNIYFMPFFIFLGLYITVFVILLIIEFGIRHTTFSSRNLRFVIFRNIKEDLSVPLFAVREILNILLAQFTRLLPVKRKFIWHSNATAILFSIAYILLFAVEIIAFNRINHFGASDWWNLIPNGYMMIRNIITGS